MSAMSIKKFCTDYGVGETTVYRQIARGHLRAVKVGRKTLIPADAARDWLNGLPRLESTTGLNASQDQRQVNHRKPRTLGETAFSHNREK